MKNRFTRLEILIVLIFVVISISLIFDIKNQVVEKQPSCLAEGSCIVTVTPELVQNNTKAVLLIESIGDTSIRLWVGDEGVCTGSLQGGDIVTVDQNATVYFVAKNFGCTNARIGTLANLRLIVGESSMIKVKFAGEIVSLSDFVATNNVYEWSWSNES